MNDYQIVMLIVAIVVILAIAALITHAKFNNDRLKENAANMIEGGCTTESANSIGIPIMLKCEGNVVENK